MDAMDEDAVEEEQMQYAHGPLSEEELNAKYPNRPHNFSKTLPFHELFTTLFNPLNENKKKPAGPVMARKKQGPHGPVNLSPHEQRRAIIERFISRWRKEVGNDIYPAFRLILPEKDRDRGMYGLKEKTIGKLLVRVMRIDKDSEDGYNLLNWKLPGQRANSAMAGDFAGRCYEVLSKRPMRTTVGDMTIAEVNEMLDRLSVAQKEEIQYPIFQDIYKRMNAEELMWLIRIILRQMKVGASEKTIFDLWHPDAENLFNVSSSLRRVCWELYDPNIRLLGEECGVTLMQCFQPQLAAFQMHSFEKMVAKLRPTEDDDAFWIEEKLDGERMQLHMTSEETVPGGKRFNFWSRKAKDYTYLYGNGFEDENGALTRHIKTAFNEGVRNIILDGEMITWDPEQDAMVPFGTLKTAALSEQRNPFSQGQRPLYRVFDCLYLNDEAITGYTLRDRRRALEASINSIHRRLEIHTYTEAHSASEIEPLLRQVVAEASEGLVLKSPRSMYRLNERNDDWIKVKPEYMTEYGEALDCVIVGGYYGSGHRGGRLSSFLCGLRVDQNQIQQGANPMKCFSFFKVGGGMTASDYANIRHHTEGKWHKWDPKNPPTDYVELAGGVKQFERPDVWIKPDDSLVVSVKAASVAATDQFRMGLTLRFPRFKRLRMDKDWRSALSIQGFLDVKNNAEREQNEKAFKVDDERRQRVRKARKKSLLVAGDDRVTVGPFAGPQTKLFEGLTFYVMTESLQPRKQSKAEIEQLVKANGGKLVQTHKGVGDVICIANRNLVKVASIQRSGTQSIVKPSWIFDCITQSERDTERQPLLLPFEPSHLFYATDEDLAEAKPTVDEYGDSYMRDVDPQDLRHTLEAMATAQSHRTQIWKLLTQLEDDGLDTEDLVGFMFRNLTIYLDQDGSIDGKDHGRSNGVMPEGVSFPIMDLCGSITRFGKGKLATHMDDLNVTHIVVRPGSSRSEAIRQSLLKKSRYPRIVSADWILESWKEHTLLDEDRFAV